MSCDVGTMITLMLHTSSKSPTTTNPQEQGYWKEKCRKERTRRFKGATENTKVGVQSLGERHSPAEMV